MKERDLRYWYDHTSMLGFARVIRESLPWYVRLVVKEVYVDEKRLDNRNQCIRAYFSFKGYAEKDRLCKEFSLSDLEELADGSPTITKRV